MQGNPDQGGIFIPEHLLPEVKPYESSSPNDRNVFCVEDEEHVYEQYIGDPQLVAKECRAEAYRLLAFAYFADSYTPEDES